MSWIQQKTLPPLSTSSANASSSSSLLSTSHSSLNINNTIYNTTNRNVNPLRQACQPILNAAQQTPDTLMMTSQYSNQANTLSKTPLTTAMPVNPNSAYQQSLTQQQLHQQPPQRHHQEQFNSLQQPTPHVTPQTTTEKPNASHLQGAFNNSCQQQSSWPTQQPGYFAPTKMMPPTPAPPTVSAATAAAQTSWPHQPPQQVQQTFQNVNMYQQNMTAQQQQQWPQKPNQIPSYDNFYQQQQPQQQQQPANKNVYQQQQPQIDQQKPHTYFQQQPTQSIHSTQVNPVNYFDQSNNNNSTACADSWSDWDWNENSTITAQPGQADQINIKPETNVHALQASQSINQHQPVNSVLAESFSTENNNDSWSWGSNENEQQPSHKESQNNNWTWNHQASDKEKIQQQLAESVPPANEQQNDKWNWQSPNENQQLVSTAQNMPEMNKITTQTKQIDSSTPPPPPPPTEFSSLSASENHNYNTNATATQPNNIPNTVFVTQAKPVTLPSRQFASPPSGNTPIAENPTETALMPPPQGFQNTEDSYHQSSHAVVTSPPLPTPALATPPLANVPPSTVLPPTSNKTGNPFKRSGVAQHHRATGILATTASSGQIPEPTAFNMPPPPPANFANPGAITLMEPDNNELPSQENQEVVIPPTTQITLPNSTIQSSAGISVPTNILMQAPPPLPPPNDERNQYLQTSHLSENSEEQQPEVDGLLPPPGLSRLVLGEPELEASQQRMVMGIEAPNAVNNMNQAAVMHLEERHADGEDTASENAIPVTSSAGQGVPTTSSSMSSDRNLYMVPGESNVASSNQQHRVVTGVELAEQREIEMDGENLEDEQIQHPGACLSAEARNEPPVEGADDTVATLATSAPINTSHATDSHLEQQNNHKIKDSNAISSPNDEDDSDERLLNDRGMNQSTAGSSKSRTKYEIERLSSAARRRDKRSSAERYESDEYLNSDGEYSSEREDRERRDRSDRRRNYREGSVRSDRGLNEEDDKRLRRHRVANKRDKYYYDGDERSRGGRDERERDNDRDRDRERDKGLERSKPERRSQRKAGYDADSRYETEESTRFDSRKDTFRRGMRHNDRGDQAGDYDDYNRRGAYRSSKRSVDNYDSDRRDRRRSEKHREPRFREDPRYDPREYEDYRKHSSRNARESDMEKEGAVTSRSGRSHHDPRHAAASAMYGYPSGGYYDPYTAYYYQQMARTNPQAYAEWYKKYYGQAASSVTQGAGLQGASNAGQADLSLTSAANDGRESVHSGRSSAHNDIKDRYTHAYITQANDYHRHYQHQHQQQQQHLHQQHFHQQQQQQMAFNKSLNSTMFDEESLNHNASIYSGLGSLSLARSNTNLSQIHGGYYMPATTVASTTAGVYYARSDYAESRSGGLSLRDSEPISQEPQRLTPCKFITEHTVVNFASGILVTVKPKYTPNGNISNIVKLLKFKPNDETRKLFKAFPGPLVRGLTHKKTIIEFCQEQIRLGPLETTIYAKQLIINNEEKYRGSYTLMWNLLILLLKQNGMVVGTDIAELLLKNQQQFPYQTATLSAQDSFESKSGSNSPTAEDKDTEEAANLEQQTLTTASEKLQENNDAENNSLAKSSNNSMSLTEDEITEKFRNYLLYGNVNEALEWATDNNLWGHALFLASKLDRRSHANVMMKFANKLSLNDPLQTLYQLMSGRTPSSVTCVQDEKWGDWRPHLSMILSNTSQKPELDRKAITTLGDSLFNRGDLYAAQFCYLMAQVNFGRYQETATHETSLQQHLPKLVLLGASHYKQFKDFAQNEAIIMTEIYEYACSLNDDKFSIVEFQPYKFLLATRLLDYGFHLKSLMYLEQAAGHIARDPSKYESSFINKVYEMADRLKYYDPALEKTIDDQQLGSDDNNALNLTPQQMEEQKWLQNLRQLAQQYGNVYNNASSSAVTTAGVQDFQVQPQLQEPSYYNQQQQIDQQFMEINKQFSELNLQYQQATTEGHNEQQQHQHQQQQLQEQPAVDLYQKQEPQQSLQTEVLNQNVNNLQQPVESQLGETLQNVYQQQPQYLQPEVTPPQPMGYNTSYYDPSQYNTVDAGNNNLDNQQQANYDYWSQQQQQSLMPQITEENVRPTISMPKTKTYDTDDDNLAKTQQQQQQVNKTQQQAQQQQQKGAKKEDANKNQQQSNQNSGWFGGIWNKFSLKPKNQMILPDDKNPSIVWDPEKKKWVNTDGDGDEQEALKPPPKMTDLMPQQHSQQPQNLPPQQPTQTNQIPFMDPQQMMQQQQQQQQTQLQQFVPNSITQSTPSPNPLQQQQNLNQSQSQVPGPAKTPTLQSNMFKMQRNRTLKNAYVDVFNPSGAPVNKAAENILAPALPPATVPQSGFLIPGSMPANAGSSEEQQYQLQQHQQQQQPQQQDTPQFYNPNQFTSGTGY